FYSVRDRELVDRVLVTEAAISDRVVQLDLEALSTADLTLHREGPAEHGASRRERPRQAPQQVARGEHVAHLALLVQAAVSLPGHVRAQHQSRSEERRVGKEGSGRR